MAKKKTSAPPAVKKPEEQIDINNPEFQKALELLQFTNRSVFLTGKAGTGKSTFLRYITSHLDKKKIVLAPTGIAAVNVGGQTLHSFFRLPHYPVLKDDPEFAPLRLTERMKYPGWLKKLIKELELIIIDEISMVRADTIDFIDRLLRHFSGNRREPFGGKQLLLVGDIFQLEPVVSADMRPVIRRIYPNPFFFSAEAFSGIGLIPIELRKVYRQSETSFISLLDRIRSCRVTPDDIALLNSRVIPESSQPEQETRMTMTLASRRDTVDYINERHIDAINKPEYTFMGVIENDFPDNSLPTDLELTLKEGAQIVFIKNDPEHRWVNGTLGTVTALAKDLVQITLENGTTYTIDQEVWENVRYKYDAKTKKITEEVLGTFKQYPVKLAWALTIHKSQGLTFSNVVIDLGRGAFAGGQTYVALSRCRSFDGLTLRSTIADRDVFVNPSIIEFSSTFNSPALIQDAIENAHADRCYRDAITLADDGKLSEAFDRFVEASRVRPCFSDDLLMRFARRKLGVADKLRSRITDLERQIEEQNQKFAELAQEYASMGADCLQDELLIPALSNFDKALSLCPVHEPSLRGRASALMSMGDFEKALADYRTILDLTGPTPELLILMAEAYHKMADNVNALERCMAVEDLVKGDSGSLPRRLARRLFTLLADIHSDLGDHDASEHYRGLAEK